MSDDFVPDADAQEQDREVRPAGEGDERELRSLPPDAPEADALEQQLDIPDDDDERDSV